MQFLISCFFIIEILMINILIYILNKNIEKLEKKDYSNEIDILWQYCFGEKNEKK